MTYEIAINSMKESADRARVPHLCKSNSTEKRVETFEK